MVEVIDYLGLDIEIRRRSRKKNLAVSVYPTGVIRVSVNKSIGLSEILKFLESHQEWLLRSVKEADKIRAQNPEKFFKTGEIYTYLGAEYRLQLRVGTRVNLEFVDNEILFTTPIADEAITPKMRQKYFKSFCQAYKRVAEKIMLQRLKFYSQTMGLHPTGAQFRGQKSIWGSCSPENKISLNYKLIVAPIEVIDYVIIHELAHIKYKNHSPKFWSLVEEYTPHRHFAKVWLRENQFKGDFLSQKTKPTV